MKTRKPSTTSTAAQGFHLPAGVSSRKEPVPGGGDRLRVSSYDAGQLGTVGVAGAGRAMSRLLRSGG